MKGRAWARLVVMAFLLTLLVAAAGHAPSNAGGITFVTRLEEEEPRVWAVAGDLFAELENRLIVYTYNRWATQFEGELRVRFEDPVTGANETTMPVVIDGFAYTPHEFLVSPPAGVDRYVVNTTLTGTAGNWTGTVSSQQEFLVVPPVSVRLLEPVPRAEAAVIERSLPEQNRTQWPLTLVSPEVSLPFRVLVENFGSVPASGTLRLVFTTWEPDVTWADVAYTVPARANATVDLGAFRPVDVDPGVARPRQKGFYDFEVLHVRNATTTAPAYSFSVNGSVAGDFERVAIRVLVSSGLGVEVIVAPVADLGRVLAAQLNLTNFGSRRVANREVVVTYIPPFRANYGVQGATVHSVRVSLGPGENRLVPVPFTPKVTGQWVVEAVWHEDGDDGKPERRPFGFRVPTDIDVRVPPPASMRGHVGSPLRVAIQVDPRDNFTDATLHAAMGVPEGISAEDRDEAQRPVLGGLAAQMVRTGPEGVRLGPLANGTQRLVNLTFETRGIGSYLVVPYVVSGPYAYTGGPGDAPEWSWRHFDRPIAIQVTVLPEPGEPGLTFLPALAILVAGLAIHFGRRLWVR